MKFVFIALLATAPAQLWAQDDMPASTRLAMPGAQHAALDPLIGEWQVEMRVYPGAGAEPIVSTDMSATREWLLDGRYVQENLTGTFGGGPSARVAIIGYNNLEGRYELVTLDTFEPGLMVYSGTSQDGAISVEGTSIEAGFGPTPTGRHRDLRFDIEIMDDMSVQRIFVRYPGEEEFLFVEQIFTQAN